MLDRANGGYRHKNETPVRLQLIGGEPENAHVFNVNGERITDLLNDPRSFIPIRTQSAGVKIVAKTQIVSMLEYGDDVNSKPAARTVSASKSRNPYAVLRIEEGASIEDIRAAYKARIKSVHPDLIASLNLDEDLSRAALLATQKLNYAYRKIMRDRGE